MFRHGKDKNGLNQAQSPSMAGAGLFASHAQTKDLKDHIHTIDKQGNKPLATLFNKTEQALTAARNNIAKTQGSSAKENINSALVKTGNQLHTVAQEHVDSITGNANTVDTGNALN